MSLDLRRRDVEGPVGRLTAYEAGSADGAVPVVLLHGNSMVATAWARLIAELPANRRYVCPEFRGHGTSVHAGPYGAEEYADDVLAVLDHLAVDRAHLVGGLFGGMVACVLAARQPDRFVSLTAVGSALSLDIDAEQAIAMMQEMGVREFHEWQMPQALPDGDPALIQEIIDGASNGRSFDTVSAATYAAFTSDVTAAAEKVQCPALVVNGENDPACTPALGELMAKVLRGSAVVMPGIGHAPMVEHPAGLAALLLPHFEATETSSARAAATHPLSQGER